MPNVPIGLLLICLLSSYSIRFSWPMVLRLHAGALKDLSSLTWLWMNQTVRHNFPLRSHGRRLAHRLGNARLQLHNLTVVQFAPPHSHYLPNGNSLLYLSTDGGAIELDAQWSLQSDLLLPMLRSPAFAGNVRARVSGLNADVSIKVVSMSELAVQQCVSRFDDFQLHFGGSLAADLIHWFHRPLAQAMQSHVEETYCQLIGEKLLPWLHEQLARLVAKLHIEFGAELVLTQRLYWIRPREGLLDLGMTQRLSHREERGRERLLAEILPWELPSNIATKKNRHSTAAGDHSVEIFLPERTLQQVFSGAHLSQQLKANFSSPFLRTNCPLLCLGKVVPQMRAALGPIQLLAVIRTNSAPTVRLSHSRIQLALNVSFELFEPWPPREVIYKRKRKRRVRRQNRLEFRGVGNNNPPPEKTAAEEEIGEDELENNGITMEYDERGGEWDEEGETDERVDRQKEEADEEGEEKEEEQDNIIRPQFVGIGQQVVSSSQRPVQSTQTPSPLLPLKTSSSPAPRAAGEIGVNGNNQKNNKIGNDRMNPNPSSSFSEETEITRIPLPRANFRVKPVEPVLRIVLDSEVDILLVLDRPRRRLRTELSLKKVRAVLAQGKIQNLSQKTIDLMIEASVPFLENAVRILYRDGLELDNLLALPTRNESVQIDEGFVRLGADLSLAQLLQ